MHYFLYPTKDATIYSGSTPNKFESTSVYEQNTGLDEILEIDKWNVDTGLQPVVREQSVSRTLLQFNLNETDNSLSQSIVDGTITNPTYSLKLYTTEQTSEIPLSYQLNCYPLSSSWEMGIGKKADNPITSDGVTWMWRDASGSMTWTNPGADWVHSKTLMGWGMINFLSSQTFEHEQNDIDLDVTDAVKHQLLGNIDNHGFIIKHVNANEQSTTREYGSLKFFSRDTHTIYVPKLDVSWDDQSFSTGSLDALDVTDGDIVLYMKGVKNEYKQSSKTRFNVYGRRRIVENTFSTSSQYLTISYLPVNTYYSIIDYKTDEVVIPFSSNTKVSCDSSGNYFNFWMSTLQKERHYKIVYKVDNGTNTFHFDDNKFIFKVVK
tara:strand:+ start:5764 stop:6897 length:1134 start_codon:yes stop_codon:yes gene_type:complete